VPTSQRRFDTADVAGEEPGVRGLHTVAMIAAVTRVPVAAVRHWIRAGFLRPVRRSGRIGWFDYGELVIARRLARLMGAGLELREIDARLAGLHPLGAVAAAREDAGILVDGRRLSVRRGGQLLGAGGQRQFAFYGDDPDDQGAAFRFPAEPWSTPFSAVRKDAVGGRGQALEGDLQAMAAELEAMGEFDAAAEALRALLQAAGPCAQVSFSLAELLYRAGDRTAARERYYAAIELEPDHLEARTSLGCVLAELGELDLAEAALDGVLSQQPDYADAHWHLAGVLEELGRRCDAQRHLRAFLALAPDSPWARSAQERLDLD
jgi:tetratricopeptide (TPR) repeat protein